MVTCTDISSTREFEEAVARRSHLNTVRELWSLREQARVREVERGFLRELETVLGRTVETLLGDDELRRSSLDDEFYGPEMQHESAHLDRYRERRGFVMEEVRALTQRHHVQRLNRFFTEAQAGTIPMGMARSASWASNLAEARTVSNALDSEFRHHLEHIVSSWPMNRRVRRRHDTAAEPHVYHEDSLQEQIERIEREEQDSNWIVPSEERVELNARRLVTSIRALEEEVSQLKNTVSASFDIQLEIQRAIRQEVAAAISGAMGIGSATTFAPGGSKPRQAGRCTVCLEKCIDSVLYSCGHMCTCSTCGRGLLAAGQKCPICRAPVRDVVRCFVVDEANFGT